MKKKIFLVALLLQISLANFAFSQADPTLPAPKVTLSKIGTVSGEGGIVSHIQTFGGYLLLIAGALAVVMIIVGGVRYMVSMGNTQQAEGAKKTLMYAVGGLIVVVLSAFIVKIILAFFTIPPKKTTHFPGTKIFISRDLQEQNT